MLCALILALCLAAPVARAEAPAPVASVPDLAHVLPVLRPADLIAPPALAVMPHQAFPGNLVQVWVVEDGGYLTYVDNDTLTAMGQGLPALAAAGLTNLRAKAAAARVQPVQNIQALVLDGTYDSSLLLVPDLWPQLGLPLGTLVVAVPTRDVVLLANGADPAQVQSLRQILASAKGKFEHPVSDDLFRWGGTAWQVLPR